jgi:hypothetical protein
MGTAIFSEIDRAMIACRGRNLEYFTIAWATLEATIALVTAIKSNSLSLPVSVALRGIAIRISMDRG